MEKKDANKTSMQDLADKLGVKIDVKAVWEEVKANQKKLNECKRPHDFSEVASTYYGSGRPRSMRCTKCSGTVEHLHAVMYKEGLADAVKTAKENA